MNEPIKTPSELTTLSGALVNTSRAYDIASRSFNYGATTTLDMLNAVNLSVLDTLSTASQDIAATMLTRVTESNVISRTLDEKIGNFVINANAVDNVLLSTMEINNTEQIALHSALVSRISQRTNRMLVSIDSLENTFIKTDGVTAEVDKFVSAYDGLLEKAVPTAVESTKNRHAMKTVYSLTLGVLAGSLT